jgi:hypothetical protein
MTPATVAPSEALSSALQAVRDVIATLSADDQARVNNAFDALGPAVKDELDLVAATYRDKLPAFGAMADGIVRDAICKALDEGLSQLTAAKAKIGA